MGYLKELVVMLPGFLTAFLLTAFAVWLSIAFVRRRRKVWLLNQIPGPKGLPLLGNALDLMVEPKELFQKLISFGDYGEMARIWIGFTPIVFITRASAAEVLLSSSKLIDKSDRYQLLQPWLGLGLLTSTGNKWRSRRKLLTPAFHFKILEDFIVIFNTQSNKMVEKLQHMADGKPFNIFHFITRCTLDMICETAMGISINAQDEGNDDYIDAIHNILHMVQQRATKAWQQSDLLYKLSGYAKKRDHYIKILHDTSLKTIRERRKLFQEKKAMDEPLSKLEDDDHVQTKKKRHAFLDLLLEYSQGGQTLSNEDIREEVDTFMFEGHDTTTTAINWTLFLLGCHPEIQAKVHKELDDIFGDTDRPVDANDLRELKYLELCIKESLRIFPPVPLFGRQITEDAVIGKYRIPANTILTVLTYNLHRDPEQFPDPEVFDPERFLPHNTKDRHPYAYTPFSAGPRNCIGQKFAMMEEKIILSNILRSFRVESHETRDEIKVLGELLLRPADGNKVKLFPRKMMK